MMDYAKDILGRLLDKFEASSSFKTGAAPVKRFKLRLYDSGVTEYPPYNIEDSAAREEINRTVIVLAKQDLVLYKWMKGEERHLIAQVWLNAENIPEAYKYIKRRPGEETINEIRAEIEELLGSIRTDWMRRYLEDALTAFTEKRKLKSAVPGDPSLRRDLFKAFSLLDAAGGGPEMLERVFSMQCYGDSKAFKNRVKWPLLGILKRFSDFDDDAPEDELLRFIGIARYPEYLEFRGPLFFGTVDFSPLTGGAALNSGDLDRGKILLPGELESLITIENRANYFDYISRNPNPRELVVYHGGQYSPAKGRFFKALAAVMPASCIWRHWGDIDFGGFSMLARLRREIKSDVQPWRMNREELEAYRASAVTTAPAYLERLKTLLTADELADCRPCIEYMIAKKIRLEQEAML